jgi:HPt (histidine-containing phosphotransfer) domain-containing protein
MRQEGKTAVLDREQLRDACMDDQALMRELVASLIDDTTQQLIALQTAVEHADSGECKRVAHYVKGACANLGAATMAVTLSDIEDAAITENFIACQNLLATLSTEFQKFRSEATTI